MTMPPTTRKTELDEGQRTKIWTVLESSLRGHFRFSDRNATQSSEESDYHDVMTSAFAAIMRRLDDQDKPVVEEIEGFARTVGFNSFKAYLRKKYPARFKLSLEIRTTLELDPRLALWQVNHRGIGGESKQVGQPASMDQNGKLVLEQPNEAKRKCFADREPNSYLTSDLLLTFYRWIRGPFGFDHTVSFCFNVLGIQEIETIQESPDMPDHQSQADTPKEIAEAKALAEFIWAEVKELDVKRRVVFLLFEPPGDAQDPICDKLVMHQVCSIVELAGAVGLTLEEFVEVRSKDRVTYDVVGKLVGISSYEAENIRRGVTDLLWRRLAASGLRGDGI
jgi:hypothetical protein